MNRLLSLLVILLAITSLAVANTIIYDNLPSPQPPNVPSLGYQATQTAEFGGEIQFAGTDRDLVSGTVLMSDWALQSDWPGVGTASGYTEPLTLNLYNVGAGDTVGSLIGTSTVSALIPWRPAADPTCPGGTAWRASDGSCYNGYAFTVDFNLTGITVPDKIIFGLAYNTETWGYNPYGVPGPYDSLNFGLADTSPSVGTDPLPDTAYWNTATAANYADGGAGGTGTFRQDTNWTPFNGAISFTATAVPEPATVGLIGVALFGLCLFAPSKNAANRKVNPGAGVYRG